MSKGDKLYLTVRTEDGLVASHTLSDKEPSFDLPSYKKLEDNAHDPLLPAPVDFQGVLKALKASMDLYLKFIPLTLSAFPFVSRALSSKNLNEFIKSKATRRDDLSSGGLIVYEFHYEAFQAFRLCEEEIVAVISGVQEIPKTMIIGLISAFDLHVSRLLSVVLRVHPEIIFTSERTLTFAELRDFVSIDAAMDAIILREIDSVLRDSHHEQFYWMEKKFGLALRSGLDVWPLFVELCERRNLFTHTGGIINPQYLKNCGEAKYDVGALRVGMRLDANSEYFARAVRVIYEVGAKLIYVLWRKFRKEESDKADEALNQLCFELVYKGYYIIAESILTFGANTMKKYGGNDKTRRMMVVNLANSILLQQRVEEAKSILHKEDWSASSDEFQICVCAVSGNVDQAVSLMYCIGANSKPSREDYRTWPVFRELSKSPKFLEAFEDIFKCSFVGGATIEDVNEIANAPAETKH